MAREGLSEYLEAVGAQIRWRRARRPLLRELSDHIADQAAAFEAEGRSPDEALAATLAIGYPAVRYVRTVTRQYADLTRL